MEPRYEFRAWGGVAEAAQALRTAATDSNTETVRDCYVLAPDPEVNAKLRDQTLDVKQLVRRHEGLEQWKPSWSEQAPFSSDAVDRLFEDLGLQPPAGGHSGLDIDALIGLLRSRFEAAWVTKRRTHLRLDTVMAEETEIELERTGEILPCVVLEAAEPDPVIELRRRIGLDGAENVPVHLAVARSLKG